MKPLLITLFTSLILCCAMTMGAQQYAATQQAAQVTSQTLLSVDDIIKLSKAGLSDDVIVQQIKKKGQAFDLSTEQLVQLKSASVSDQIIQVMIDPTKAATSLAKRTAAEQSSGKAGASPTDVVPAQSFVESSTPAQSGSKPRVYLASASKGNQWNAARDQSMEMSKDFEKDCPSIRVTINQSAADYSVVLNHIEHGFARDNQIQIANKDGDLISKTKEGGSIRGDVKKACEIILADWAKK